MNGKTNRAAAPTRRQIAARAHRIWEQEGLPPGLEVEHWLRAERELVAVDSCSPAPQSPRRQTQHSAGRKSSTAIVRGFRFFNL